MTTGGGSRWGCDHHLLPRGVVAEPGGQGIPVLVGIFRSLGVVHGFSPDLLEQLQDVHKILREGVLPSVVCCGSLEMMKIELTWEHDDFGDPKHDNFGDSKHDKYYVSAMTRNTHRLSGIGHIVGDPIAAHDLV